MKSTLINAMTVDVEDYFHVAALSGSIKRNTWDKLASRVEKNTDELLDIFDAASVSATFFVLGWVAERYPGIVKSICDGGHELACHGYSHQLIYKQSPKVFADETRKAKAILEDVSGRSVRGYRAASYSITAQSIWALDILLDAGFEYDSSIVPVAHDLYGFAGAEVFPHRLTVPNGRSIVEFPPSTIKILGKRIPIGGGGYFRIFPYWFSKWGLGTVNRKFDLPFSFYLHPWEIDPDQPRVRTGWKSRFRHYTNLDKCKHRLIRLLSSFEFATMQSVIDDLQLPVVRLDDIVTSSIAHTKV